MIIITVDVRNNRRQTRVILSLYALSFWEFVAGDKPD